MTTKDRLVLVTGGTGYIGTALAPVLARAWPIRVYCTMNFGNPLEGVGNVEIAKGDIRDEKRLREALAGVTDVVHLAGVVTDELVAMNEAMSRTVNQDATAAICRIAREAGVRRLLYASAGSVYGAQDSVCSEETLPKPMSAYARMKLEGEGIVNSYAGDAFAVCSLRIAGCCGPALRMRLDTMVNVFSKQAYFDGVITVHGGDQWRSNVHVQDLAELFAFLLDAPAQHVQRQVFNVAADTDRALGIAQRVQRVASDFFVANGLQRKSPELSVDLSKQDRRHYRLDATKLRRVLGWQPRRTLEDAVRDNLRWFADGRLLDPNNDLYYNTRRMKEVVRRDSWPARSA